MTLLNMDWMRCEECGEISHRFVLQSYSTAAPPPVDLNYDLKCDACGSENVKRMLEDD